MIRLALETFALLLRQADVLIYTDNMMVRAYVNGQGGTRSWTLQREA